MVKFRVRYKTDENITLHILKKLLARFCPKDTEVLREIFIPEYPQEPDNILQTPSSQVKNVMEANMQ